MVKIILFRCCGAPYKRRIKKNSVADYGVPFPGYFTQITVYNHIMYLEQKYAPSVSKIDNFILNFAPAEAKRDQVLCST